MLDFASLPIGPLAGLIFVLRVLDVTLGTVRTISIVEGRIKSAVLLGFVEVVIWITAISQVMVRIHESPLIALAFAGGFATGNAVGLWVEGLLARGEVILRIIATRDGERIASQLRGQADNVTTFSGNGQDGAVTLVYVYCQRRRAREMLRQAQVINADLAFVLERANSWGSGRHLVAHPTGWRAVFKRK
jgi:uncharacterized protein YebE (UPF0316 family)